MSNPTSTGISHCAGARMGGMSCDLREGAALHKELQTVDLNCGVSDEHEAQ